MIKKSWASLTSLMKTGLDKLQAGPRTAQGNPLNYTSVHTLDPARLARAFAAADGGYITEQAALFELVEEQDAHIFSELGKRRRAVTGLGWMMQPPKDASQSEIDRTAELEGMLRSIPRFEDAQYDITDAIGKGLCALEIDWKTGSTWLPRELHFVPQREFQVDRETGSLQLLKNGIPEPLREGGWIVHEHRAKSGYIEQAALFRVLAWTYAYKAYDVRDMQRFLELYGMPLRLGKYPAGMGVEARNELLKAVRKIGSDGAGVVPSTMAIDFVQAASGKVGDFLDAVDYWERKQSMAITGGDLDGKTATEARILIYDKVRREIMLHDVRQIEPTINAQLVRPINSLNGIFPENRLPVFRYLTEETVDQAKMVKVLKEGASMGMEIDVDYAHQVTQIPRARDGAKLLVSGAAQPQAADATLVRLAALVAKAAEEGDVTGAYSAQLAALCAPHEQAVIQQVAAAVAEAGDFETALQAVEELTIKLKPTAWGEAMALGMAAGNLAGRSEVKNGD